MILLRSKSEFNRKNCVSIVSPSPIPLCRGLKEVIYLSKKKAKVKYWASLFPSVNQLIL
jgi:hypothetical protein